MYMNYATQNKLIKIIWISFGAWRGYWFTNLGIHTISGYINKHYNYNLIQHVWYYDKNDFQNFLNYLLKNIPDYVCFSVNIGFFERTLEVAKVIKSSLRQYFQKHICFIFGNREFFDYDKIEKLLAIIPESLVIQGEGEDSVLRILNNSNFENVPNLYYKIDDKILYTYRKTFNPKDHITPLYNLYIINKKPLNLNQKVAYVEVSRGCSKKTPCTYCSNSMNKIGKKWELLNIDIVINTIEQISINKPIVINFVSEDFLGNNNINIHYLIEKLEQMKINGIIDQKTNFYCAVKVVDVYLGKDTKKRNEQKRKLLLKMKTLGFHTLYVGFESGSDVQLKRYNKEITRKDNIEAIRILRELDINIDGGFITFDPLMTLDDCIQNILFLKETNIPKLLLFPFNQLIVFPNTTYFYMYRKRKELVDHKVKKLINIVKYIDKFIPYDLFELFLQRLRLYYFANTNIEKISQYESILKEYGKLTLPFLENILNMLLNNRDYSVLNKIVNNFLNDHKLFSKNLGLWLKKDNLDFI